MSKQDLLNQLKVSYDEINNISSDFQIILNKEIEHRNDKALAIQSWFNNITKLYLDFKTKIENDEITSFTFDNAGEMPYSFTELYEHVEEEKISNYKISPYVDVNFTDSRIHLVDFKRHLKADVALTKKTYRLPNGRPDKNEYYYNSVLMAKIYFIFETNENNLLTRRTEKLVYIKNDDTDGTEIIIKDKIYDITDVSDASLVVQERVIARTYIVDSLNIFILGVLGQYHPDKTQNELIMMVLPYWNDCESDRLLFIDLGLPNWKDSLGVIDLTNLPSDRAWLGYVIDGNGTTVRDYAYNVLNY